MRRNNNFENIFTPEVLAELDASADDAREGKTYSQAQVNELLAENRAAWLEKHEG